MTYKPGQSGNPAGRPKGSGSRTKEWLAAVDQIDEKTGKTFYQMFIELTIKKAIEGDHWAGERLSDRVEGKLNVPLSLSKEEEDDWHLENLSQEKLDKLELLEIEKMKLLEDVEVIDVQPNESNTDRAISQKLL